MALALLLKRFIKINPYRVQLRHRDILDSLKLSVSMIVAMSTIIETMFHLLQNFARKYVQDTDTYYTYIESY